VTIGPGPCTIYYAGGTGGGNPGPYPQPSPTAASSAFIEQMLATLWPGSDFTAANGYNVQIVPYPAAMEPFSPDYEMSFSDSIDAGATIMEEMITNWFDANSTGILCLSGVSQGASLVDKVLRDIESWSSPPPTDRLTYLTIANPSRPGGAFCHWWGPGSPLGTDIPIINYANTYPCPNTRYSGTYLFWQYDGGGSDWPDLVAVPTSGGSVQGFLETVAADILCPMPVMNAMLGFLNLHIGVPLSGGIALESLAGYQIGAQVLEGPLYRGRFSAAQHINTTTYSNGGTCESYMLPTYPVIVPCAFMPPITFELGNTIFGALYELMYNRAARPWGSAG